MRPEITTIVEAGLSRELKSLTLALLGEDHRAAALALALIETIEIVCTAAAEEAREAEPAEERVETASQVEAAVYSSGNKPKRTRRSKAEMEAAKKLTPAELETGVEWARKHEAQREELERMNLAFKEGQRIVAQEQASQASADLKKALVDSVAETEPAETEAPAEEEKVPTLEEARAAIAAASKRLGQPAVFKILSGYGPSLSAFSDKQRQDAMRDLANA